MNTQPQAPRTRARTRNAAASTRAATHVALLRGINVGKAKRVAMADLRALFEHLGFQNVRTLLNSGNVVFSARGGGGVDGAAIERAMTSRLQVSARIIVMTVDDLGAIVSKNPLLEAANDPSRLFVAFLADAGAGRELQSLIQKDWSPERLAAWGRAAYLWCPAGLMHSDMAVAVNRVLADRVTARNWATVLKLHAMATS